MSPRARIGLAFALTLVALALLRLLAPDPATRREWGLSWMLPLGYGHQLAAVVLRRRGPASRSRVGLGLALLASSAAGFGWLVSGPAAPTLVAALAAVAVWHGVENELAMARAAARGSTRLAPLPRSLRRQLVPLLVTALVLLASLALPRLGQAALRLGVPGRLASFTTEELVAALLFQHVVSFLLFRMAPRGVPSGRAGAVLRARIGFLHLLPGAVALAASFSWPALLEAMAWPPLYLYASLAHAVATLHARGAEPV